MSDIRMDLFDPNDAISGGWTEGIVPSSEGVVEYDVIEVYSQLQRGDRSVQTAARCWYRKKA